MITQKIVSQIQVCFFCRVFISGKKFWKQPFCPSSRGIGKLLSFLPSWIPGFHQKPALRAAVEGSASRAFSICCSQLLHCQIVYFHPCFCVNNAACRPQAGTATASSYSRLCRAQMDPYNLKAGMTFGQKQS